jgi:hypothetical protein
MFKLHTLFQVGDKVLGSRCGLVNMASIIASASTRIHPITWADNYSDFEVILFVTEIVSFSTYSITYLAVRK